MRLNKLGFAGFLLSITILFSCGKAEPYKSDKNYEEYSEFSINDLDDFYTFDGDYFVYMYRPGCSYCDDMKGNIFDYFDNFKDGIKTIQPYMFDIKEKNSPEGKENRDKFKEKPNNYVANDLSNEILLNEMRKNRPASLDETYFISTPMLYYIKDHSLYDVVLGSDNVCNFLASL